MSENDFPGFEGKPTMSRFPLYVGWREGKAAFRLGIQVREIGVKAVAPRPLDTFPTVKDGEKLIGDLNDRVARAVGLY